MSEKRVSVRFAAQGGGQVRAEFKGVGDSGTREFKRIEDQADATGRVLTRVMGILATAVSVRELVRYADTWTDLRSRVDLATGSQEAGAAVMDRLGEMARRTYSDLAQTTEAFLANATALGELGMSTRQQLDFTEALNNAIVVSGARQERAAQISNALSQAMALGALRGQQLNTVIQNGGRVAELLAAELGVNVNQLREVGAQGLITGNVINRALVGNLELLREEAESMPATIGDAFVLMGNMALQLVGQFNETTRASALVADTLIFLGDQMARLVTYAGTLAAFMGGRYVASFVAARVAMIAATGALETFRLALVRFLPFAVIVGVGELVARLTGLTGRAAEARRAIDDLNISLGNELRALDLLNPAMGLATQMSVDQAVAKLRETKARHENIVAIMAEQRALAQSTAEFAANAREISGVMTRIGALQNTGRDGGIFAPQANRADIEFWNKELARLAKLRGDLLQSPEQTEALREAESQIRRIEDAIANARDGVVTFGEGFGPVIDGAIGVTGALRRVGEAATGAGNTNTNAAEKVLEGWAAVTAQLDEYAKAAADWGKGIGDALTGAFTSAENAFADFVTTGKADFRSLANSILADLARIAARQFILGPIANALSGALGGLGGAPLNAMGSGPLASFDGGGHTGFGARSGGLDGRGGFLAVMHPNETVIDHTKGQRGAGEPVQVVVRVLPSVEFDARVENTARAVVRVETPGMIGGAFKRAREQRGFD
ncbi:tape measure protein [Roseinatronobacter bogoriensis]|uniref:Uncharacterized protein n=1 Tax=Roseinatronobacter bogoriensis subsp. barguzinensis TaxID=441209 RepID=A0A2K8KB88_9RHOB|nr:MULTISPECIES: tape measure protein [Rhodobaca]ATX66702.1 hypothetical protein BG454_13465 [Rhodobaca barguzinensis]MBB4207887.1 tape measure domain-containing protein [Rhodobaca bogoriensis DSM 18756]TDY71039.1 lambda family phage tail tape measure protein [Rhodobaca bogoriensis DSM 18756]